MSSFEPLPGWGRRNGFAATDATVASFRTEGAPAAEAEAVSAPASDPSPSAESEGRVQRAYEEGLAAGRSEGASREHERAFGALDAAAQEILALRDGYLAANRREVVDLALAVAAAILARPLCDDADALAGRLEGAFESVPSGVALNLSLSPSDHALLQGESTSELARGLEGRAVETQADPKLAPGEFRLQAGSAEVDGRRETLLADLRERLVEAARGEPS